MIYTREPVVETVITPRDGYKLAVRNAKVSGVDEYIVDALEVVTFGKAVFFRSQERPKCFLVPASDFEVVEVRETRMSLKKGVLEKGVKIAIGKDFARPPKEKEVVETEEEDEQPANVSHLPDHLREKEGPRDEMRSDKRNGKLRRRRRRGKDRGFEEPGLPEGLPQDADADEALFEEESATQEEAVPQEGKRSSHSHHERKEDKAPAVPFPGVLPPPTTLISETIARYKAEGLFKEAFIEPAAENKIEKEVASTEESEATPAQDTPFIDDDIGARLRKVQDTREFVNEDERELD